MTQHRITEVDQSTSTGTCSKCGLVPVAFVKNSRGHRYAQCRIAVRERAAARRERIKGTPEYRAYYRQYNRHRKYGLPKGGVQALIESAGSRCQICSAPLDLESARIDHDHACCVGDKLCGKCNRGVLCGNCNTGLGMFGDDPERLEKAAEYLRGWIDARS